VKSSGGAAALRGWTLRTRFQGKEGVQRKVRGSFFRSKLISLPTERGGRRSRPASKKRDTKLAGGRNEKLYSGHLDRVEIDYRGAGGGDYAGGFRRWAKLEVNWEGTLGTRGSCLPSHMGVTALDTSREKVSK